MMFKKIIENFKGFKIEFICFPEYPPCKLRRQKRWPVGDLLGPVRICRLLLEHIPGWPNYDQEWSIVHMWSSGL